MCIKQKLLLLIIFLFSFFVSPSLAKAHEIDLSTISNFNIRYDGPDGSNLGNSTPIIVDLNGDGALDLLVGAPMNKFFYIIYNPLLTTLSNNGNIIDLDDPSNYNIRYDSGTTGLLGTLRPSVADIDGDGTKDIIIGAPYKSNNSRSFSGSVYLLYNSLFASIIGTGNNIDITNISNYSKRFDGAKTWDTLGEIIITKDIDNDNKLDLIMNAPYASNNSRNTSGSVYVIYNSLLTTLSSQNIDLNVASKYNIRFDGVHSLMSLSSLGMVAEDMNNDNKIDLIIGAHRANFNSRTDSGSLYIIYNSLISRFSSTGNNVDLTISTNYNLRFDGPAANGKFGNESLQVADLNNNGLSDLLVGSYEADNNSRDNSGSLYVIYDSIISTFLNTGNNIDLATATNYNLRFDGATTDDRLGTGANIADIDGDGRNDVIAHATYASFNSRTNSGSLYIIYNFLFSNYSNTTGNSIDLSNQNNYSTRYDGPMDTGQLADVQATVGDLNEDGKTDLLITAPFTNFNEKSQSGSLYVIYNFPHTILITKLETNTESALITGSISAPKSVTSVSGIQYSLDNNNPIGTNWKTCVGTTSFVCTIPNDGISNHTVYIRAFDSNNSYTAQANYSVVNFTYNTNAGPPNTSCQSELSSTLVPIITGLNYINNNSSAVLTLKNQDKRATEYIIEYGTNKINFNYSAFNIPISSETYTINKLDHSKQYFFRLRTTDGCDVSNWSPIVQLQNGKKQILSKTPTISTKVLTTTPFTKVDENDQNSQTADSNNNTSLFSKIVSWITNFIHVIIAR